MVLNKQGKVWLGHRPIIHNDEFANTEKRWQMPQGGIDEGEQPLQAAKRELKEETGIENIELLAEIDEWLYYDLPENLIGTALRGRWKGQKQKWFAVRFTGIDSEINITTPPIEFDKWAWVEMSEVTKKIVDFKKQVYERVVKEFAPLA